MCAWCVHAHHILRCTAAEARRLMLSAVSISSSCSPLQPRPLLPPHFLRFFRDPFEGVDEAFRRRDHHFCAGIICRIPGAPQGALSAPRSGSNTLLLRGDASSFPSMSLSTCSTVMGAHAQVAASARCHPQSADELLAFAALH